MNEYMKRLKELFRGLPDKKRYFELLTAVLSVPVLITVIILNINSLNNQKAAQKTSPTPPATIITIIQPTLPPGTPYPTATPTQTPTPTPTPTATPTPHPTSTPAPTSTPVSTSSATFQ